MLILTTNIFRENKYLCFALILINDTLERGFFTNNKSINAFKATKQNCSFNVGELLTNGSSPCNSLKNVFPKILDPTMKILPWKEKYRYGN